MDSQRMFSELQTGARFKFDHDADSGHVWTKTGRRDYSRIETKRIGSSSAPVTPIPPTPGDEGAAIVMLRNAGLALEDLEFLGEDVYAAFDAATLTVALSTQAGARIVLSTRSGLVPDFAPRLLLGPFRGLERAVESIPGARRLCAHNVVLAEKPS